MALHFESEVCLIAVRSRLSVRHTIRLQNLAVMYIIARGPLHNIPYSEREDLLNGDLDRTIRKADVWVCAT